MKSNLILWFMFLYHNVTLGNFFHYILKIL